MFAELQLLGHVGDHKGLADGLPAGDAKRAVAIGVPPIGHRDERLARHLFHGAQHGLIADAPPPQAELEHHLFGRFLGHDISWRDLLSGLAADPELRADRDAIAAVRLRNNFLKNPVPLPGTVTPSRRYSPGKSIAANRVAYAGR